MDRPDQPTALDANMKVVSVEKCPEIYSSPETSSKNGQRNSVAFCPMGNRRIIPESDEKKMTLPQTLSMLTDASRIDKATAVDIFSAFKLEGSGLPVPLFWGRSIAVVSATEII